MSRARRCAAALAVATAALSTAVLSPATGMTPAVARARTTSVTVTVLSVNPSTPTISNTARPLTIAVSLQNITASSIAGVTLTAERGNPITTQAALNTSLTSNAARSGGVVIAPSTTPKLSLPANTSITTTFTTTTSIQNNHLCLCANAVYPIDLTAQTTTSGVAEVLGGTRTYLPSFDAQPAHKLGVTWVWPLIDRPHRTTDGKVFTDDDLTDSVAENGRLDRALQVVEDVEDLPTATPLTLLVDPDLIDDLEVMSLGAYTVQTGSGPAVPGTGQQPAALWLARLRNVLAAHPNVDVEFTPLADPDVTGLSRHDRTWSTELPAAIAASVSTALGGGPVPTHTFAWPPSNSATVDTLDSLVAGGAHTVLLDGSLVRPRTESAIPVSSARLRTSTGSVNALLTAPALQRYAQSVLTGSLAALPELVAELAVRVTQRPTAVQGAVLAAARYVDPQSPIVAAQAISATSTSVFSQPVSAAAASAAIPTSGARSTVHPSATSSTGLSSAQLDKLDTMTGYVPAVASLIDGSPAGRRVSATLPDAVQRAESAAWSQAGAAPAVGGGPSIGEQRTAALTTQLSGYLGQVRILNRPSSSYTLASSDSPLLISVRNDSALSVNVLVSVSADGGLTSLFATREIGPVRIAAHSKATFKVRTRIQRSGRIPVQARLRTPSDYSLGGPVKLFVHSTVLGTIGVVITITAGVVLALALLVRYVRRVLRIRSRRARPASNGSLS